MDAHLLLLGGELSERGLPPNKSNPTQFNLNLSRMRNKSLTESCLSTAIVCVTLCTHRWYVERIQWRCSILQYPAQSKADSQGITILITIREVLFEHDYVLKTVCDGSHGSWQCILPHG